MSAPDIDAIRAACGLVPGFTIPGEAMPRLRLITSDQRVRMWELDAAPRDLTSAAAWLLSLALPADEGWTWSIARTADGDYYVEAERDDSNVYLDRSGPDPLTAAARLVRAAKGGES